MNIGTEAGKKFEQLMVRLADAAERGQHAPTDALHGVLVELEREVQRDRLERVSSLVLAGLMSSDLPIKTEDAVLTSLHAAKLLMTRLDEVV